MCHAGVLGVAEKIAISDCDVGGMQIEELKQYRRSVAAFRVRRQVKSCFVCLLSDLRHRLRCSWSTINILKIHLAYYQKG